MGKRLVIVKSELRAVGSDSDWCLTVAIEEIFRVVETRGIGRPIFVSIRDAVSRKRLYFIAATAEQVRILDYKTRRVTVQPSYLQTI